MNLKPHLVGFLPKSFRNRLYYLKHRKTYHVEALSGVCFNLEAHSSSSVWEKRLSQVGGHEVGLCEWFQRNIRPSDTVFEVGSCFAFFPSLISVLEPEAKVHTFEPNWKLNSFVIENAKRSCTNYPWQTNQLFICDESDGESRASLDEYSDQFSITPSIVKIDVDGPEELVLRGSAKLIESRKTQFLIEIHPHELPKYDGSVESVLRKFPSDYRIQGLTEIRDGGSQWTDDLAIIEGDNNPYISVAPCEIFRE